MKPLPAPLPLDVSEGSIETRVPALTRLTAALFTALGEPFDPERAAHQFQTEGASERYEENHRWVLAGKSAAIRYRTSTPRAPSQAPETTLLLTVTGLPGEVVLRLEVETGEFELVGSDAAASRVEVALTQLLAG